MDEANVINRLRLFGKITKYSVKCSGVTLRKKGEPLGCYLLKLKTTVPTIPRPSLDQTAGPG